ncbi:hypothetical protein VP01_208g2 [Puccinia sorghi]|uniref:NodB homology domain-containing protein n=1 Tax=Puccinia sorghi TaxID=27349 RepID=A0A0L6VC48_9BASI|nr:hypothetical protein VP01_208g2 [Puccinia sorghi]
MALECAVERTTYLPKAASVLPHQSRETKELFGTQIRGDTPSMAVSPLVDSRGPARPAGGHDTHSVVRNSVHGGDEKTRPNGSLLKHPGVKHNNQSALPRKHHAGSVPVYEACRAPGSFSLTFDDGPSEYSTALDATLDRNKVKASFYINGNNAGCIYDYADLLLRRFKAGHLIA